MNLWMAYDIIFLLCGCYGVSLCVKVRLSGQLEDIRILMPRNVKIGECLNTGEFLKRVWPWMAVFSGTTVLNGAVGIVEDMRLGLPHVVHMVTLGICVAAAVAFFVVQHKAVEEFWEQEEDE